MWRSSPLALSEIALLLDRRKAGVRRFEDGRQKFDTRPADKMSFFDEELNCGIDGLVEFDLPLGVVGLVCRRIDHRRFPCHDDRR